MAQKDVGKAKWVRVMDAAGIERHVRPVDAREIAAVAQGSPSESIKAEANDTAAAMVEVDDQSVAPKVAKKVK